MVVSKTAGRRDTRLIGWTKVLTVLQALPGSIAHNNPNPGRESLRSVLVKVLRALIGV